MAIYRSGIHGRPSGKIGNIVYYMLNGQSVARSIGKSDKVTDLQRANRQAMSVTTLCLKNMVRFINAGFGAQAAGTTKNPFNVATSYNKKHALKGEYPNLSIDYTKLVLSQGVLTPPKATTIKRSGKGVEVTWDASSDRNHSFCNEDDMVMITLYNPNKTNGYATTSLYAAQRSAGKCFIPCAGAMVDQPMEGYMFFKSNDGKSVSDSVYLGNLNGAEETREEAAAKIAYAKVKEEFEKAESKYLGLINQKDGPPPKSRNLRMMKTEYEVLQKKLLQLKERPGLH